MKLLFKVNRTRSEKVALESTSRVDAVGVPVVVPGAEDGSATLSPKAWDTLKIASPDSLVVVEN